jgi:Tol biopolymer transport system component
MICPRGNQQVYHADSFSFSDDDVVRRRAELAVFLQDFDTGKIKRLTAVEECRLIHPRRDAIAKWHLFIKHAKWAPDASRLFFVFTNEIRFDRKYGELPRVKDIYVINADGSGLRRLGEFGNHPLWHPNGKDILANCTLPGRTGLSLTLIDADTGERRLASRAMPGAGHPSFSPDGRWIALERVEKGHGKIYVVNAHTDEITLLAQPKVVDHTHQGTHLHPVWSQDSRQILIASDASGSSQLCVITL